MDRSRSWWSRLAGAAAVVVAVAAVALAVPALLPADEPAAAAPTPVASGSGETPTWDDIVALREELSAAAAAADSEYPIDAETLAAIPTAPGEYTPLGRIRIDDIDVDVEYAAGVHPSVLDLGPGHWPGTATAGQPGNAVVSGHRTTFTRPFHDIDLLEPGDPITVEGVGAPVTFEVTDTTVVTEAEYVDFVLRQPADPSARQLTLFACEPKGDRTHRIVVRAAVPEGG